MAPRDDDNHNNSSPPPSPNSITATGNDLAVDLGFKVGDRLEVLWDPVQLEYITTTVTTTTTSHYWWGATLLEYDGRDEETCAIRVLEFDPNPAAGFPEPTRNDVVFIGTHAMVHLGDELVVMTFRREGDTSLPPYPDDDDILSALDDDEEEETTIVLPERVEHVEDFVNTLLQDALGEVMDGFCRLTPDRQAAVGEIVATKKEKLIQELENHVRNSQEGIVVNESSMLQIIRRTLAEE